LSDTFQLNEGSDFVASFNWPNGAGGNADLTGCAVSLVDTHNILDTRMTATLSVPGTGKIDLFLPWDPILPLGKWLHFRVRVTTPAGIDSTTNRLWIEIT